MYVVQTLDPQVQQCIVNVVLTLQSECTIGEVYP
jgi:hypothetical protein